MAGAGRESAPPQPPADTLRSASSLSLARSLASRFSSAIGAEGLVESDSKLTPRMDFLEDELFALINKSKNKVNLKEKSKKRQSLCH